MPTISGDTKHNICYTLEPTSIHKMHSDEFSIKAFDIKELEMDIENAESYKNVYECLSHVAKTLGEKEQCH